MFLVFNFEVFDILLYVEFLSLRLTLFVFFFFTSIFQILFFVCSCFFCPQFLDFWFVFFLFSASSLQYSIHFFYCLFFRIKLHILYFQFLLVSFDFFVFSVKFLVFSFQLLVIFFNFCALNLKILFLNGFFYSYQVLIQFLILNSDFLVFSFQFFRRRGMMRRIGSTKNVSFNQLKISDMVNREN